MPRARPIVQAGAAVLFAGIVAIACEDVKPDGDTTGTRPPDDSGALAAGRLPHADAICDLPSAGRFLALRSDLPDSAREWRTITIPEYQDAQRFEQPENAGLGPLACVVARHDLASLSDQDFKTGVLVGLIYLESDVTTTPYTNLHLSRSGMYCVFLKGDVAGRRIKGNVVRSQSGRCDPVTDSTDLLGFVYRIPTVERADDYPPVARWTIKKDGNPAIGIRCLNTWCVVGVPSFASLDGPAHAIPAGGARGHAQHAVPGWYDQQYVSVAATGRTPPLKPMHKASVVPHDSLDHFRLDRFRQRTPVATVYFSGKPAMTKYGAVWAFKSGKNLIELDTVASGWRVFVNGSHNAKLKVTRADHGAAGIHIVGTARWKWRDKDEWIWVRCGEGCCSVEEM